ncbi:MAG: hypothetical protein ACLPN5_10055, partial [Roseiarcus sp.]
MIGFAGRRRRGGAFERARARNGHREIPDGQKQYIEITEKYNISNCGNRADMTAPHDLRIRQVARGIAKGGAPERVFPPAGALTRTFAFDPKRSFMTRTARGDLSQLGMFGPFRETANENEFREALS